MSTKRRESIQPSFVDPDDAPAWTDEQIARAQKAVGEKVVREASGTLSRGPGRPRKPDAKQVVSLRLEPEVIAAYKALGPGWQTRMSAVVSASITREAGPGGIKTRSPVINPAPRRGKRERSA